MEILFRLPRELQTHTLSFLSGCDLDRLLELPDLEAGVQNDPYLSFRHQGLYAKYKDQSLVMSNEIGFETFTLAQLEYLIHHRIVISPKEITFVLFDFTNYTNSVAFMDSMMKYLPVLEKFTRNFNIQLMLVENVSLDNLLLKSFFEPFFTGEYNVSSFTIKYHPGSGKHMGSRNNMSMGLAQILTTGTEIAVENLQLHLFNSSNLLGHLVDHSGCFYCNNLRTLDLSFNNLTDWHMKDIQFSSLLEHLCFQ